MKPILFSTEMVKAILEGRKTQTRRIVKPQPNGEYCGICTSSFENKNVGKVGFTDGDRLEELIKPKYQISDILWVRETWCYKMAHNFGSPIPDKSEIFYKADCDIAEIGGWKPSIFMPREAARIFLKVTDIRVERLQDISEDDAKAEGIHPVPKWESFTGLACEQRGISSEDRYKAGYSIVWESINGKGSWRNNPWVWVISFELLKRVK